MPTTIELLDRLEELLKEGLSEEKAKEFKSVIVKLFENSSKEIEKDLLPILEDKLETKLKNELTTKQDAYEIKNEIEKVKVEIERVRREMEQMKTDLLKWIIGLFIAQTTFITGLVFAIIKLVLQK